ncbi:hypothetical protein HDV00_012511 [Rhizophlyctis rosea]|nr:hypothetical protein HDV00_012511 [Rhizophlyctis rosea]
MMDIEDLVQFGQTHRACPYFLSREEISKADIIFLPYNYLIDAYTRKAQGIDVKNSILIFDEGWFAQSQKHDITLPGYMGKDGASADDFAILKGLKTSQSFESYSQCSNESFLAKALISKFNDELLAIPLSPQSNDLIKPGEFIFHLFSKLNVTFGNVELLLKVTDAAMDLIAQDSHQQRRSAKMALNGFQSALKTVFREGYSGEDVNLAAVCKSYKVHIMSQTPTRPVRDAFGNPVQAEDKRTLSFWCFNSGIAMKELVDRGVRSIVLASGTLSPLDSFASEMGIPFPIRLENPHVIDPSQIFVGIIPRGPSNQLLSSSYENRNSQGYVADLGNTIVNCARVIPDGLLVFFPSYGVMGICMEKWKMRTGTGKCVWERIQAFKEPIVEPKNKQDFGQAMNDFYAKLTDPNLKGAVFFAVCRGKASEGIDFSDTKGRAVIVCGIPYPAAMDPKVKLKKQYLDDLHSSREMFRGQFQTLSGNDWYKQQAARAVNQAIGRVIRHKRDYGAILLCDERFGNATSIGQLPVWIRPYVRPFKQFGEALGQLTRFFKSMETFQAKVVVAMVVLKDDY